MTNYPTLKELKDWTPSAVEIFRSIMPLINASYPQIYYATTRSFPEMRRSLIALTGCKHTEEPESSIMEYIQGDNGYAILIRQDLLPDKNYEHFCMMLWHELGHFYAIISEITDLHRYNDPGLADDSHNIEFDAAGKPVSGLSEERLKQEGYWFWQEFIAEAISKYVSYKHRSSMPTYHPELMNWHPANWSGIVDKLMMLLDETFFHYSYTVDEYSLAHYFANLLMDDFIVLYVKAAEKGLLKVYDEGKVVPGKDIEPTCISDIDVEEFQKPLWQMKKILEEQISKDDFWMIDEGFLLKLGRCIADMMCAKFVLILSNE